MRHKVRNVGLSLLMAIPTLVATSSVANAAPVAQECSSSVPAPQASAGSSGSGASTALVAVSKARSDTERAALQAISADNVAHDARKMTMTASGHVARQTGSAKSPTCASGSRAAAATASTSSVVPYLTQYPQVTPSFCGPATIAEFSATVPGSSPYNLNQWTVAGYMDGQNGGSINANGTSVGQMVNGLNHFVGQPDFGWNYYGFVSMDYNPTSAQRSAFESQLDYDIAHRSPVAGDAWEVPGGPHLIGHPGNQTIYHWFEIGGRSGSSAYYADSATSVWSSVPRFSWYPTSTLETILGGRGYAW